MPHKWIAIIDTWEVWQHRRVLRTSFGQLWKRSSKFRLIRLDNNRIRDLLRKDFNWINSLLKLLSFRTNQVRSNYREPQKMFNRKVTSSFTVQRKSNAKKNNEQAVTSLSSPPLIFNFPVAVVFLAFSTIFSRQLLWCWSIQHTDSY